MKFFIICLIGLLFCFAGTLAYAQDIPKQFSEQHDPNRDGLISQEEWLNAYAPPALADLPPSEEARQMVDAMQGIFLQKFNELDDNGDGFLSPHEAYRTR